MNRQRVICFIDGFNLYHAIKRLNAPHLKWLDLWSLSSVFIRPKTQKLENVIYFSAYADWLPESKKRHVQYVKALASCSVSTVLGKFKQKDRKCPHCKEHWRGHEEKETDVNIALNLLELAFKDKFDHAFIISNDSDLTPAIQMVRKNFPQKSITTIVPPRYLHSNELIQASTNKAKITIDHLERCLFPEIIYDVDGAIVASRPLEYSPPVILSH